MKPAIGARKGGKRRLRAAAPRLLSRHDGVRGRRYGRIYAALVLKHGVPDSDSSLATAMGRLALATVEFQECAQALDAARLSRLEAKGRRPGDAEVRRHARLLRLAAEELDRARAALQDALPPPPPPLSKRERELERRRAPFIPPHEVLARQRAAEAENDKARTESEQRIV